MAHQTPGPPLRLTGPMPPYWEKERERKRRRNAGDRSARGKKTTSKERKQQETQTWRE